MNRVAAVSLLGVVTACASTGAVTPAAEVQVQTAVPTPEANARLREIAEAMSRVHEVRVTSTDLVLEQGDTALVEVAFPDAAGAPLPGGFGYTAGGPVKVDRIDAGQLRIVGLNGESGSIIVLDLTDPAHPAILSEYMTTLTRGVHNVWLEWPYIYAVHNGTLDVHILDASDPTQVAEVGRWGIDSPGKYLHDINVWDG